MFVNLIELFMQLLDMAAQSEPPACCETDHRCYQIGQDGTVREPEPIVQ